MKKYKINISDEPHCRDLESLGSIFVPLIKNVVESEDLIGIEIILHWQDIVGQEIYNFSIPKQTKFNPKTNKRTLYLDVPVGGFALELQHKENYMLNKINAYFGYNAVHKINITQNVNMTLQHQCLNRAKKEIKLSAEENKYLEETLKDIKDEKLRKILTNIGKYVIADKKE
jgi:hypothetical protein